MSEVQKYSLFSEFDINLFKTGKHYKLYEKLGGHVIEKDGIRGTYFAVYAPAAKKVSVIGNFNHWRPDGHSLHVRYDGSGIWEGFIPGFDTGELYKYHILSNNDDQGMEKIDPYSLYFEEPPKTASVNWSLDYKWKDKQWMNRRKKNNAIDQPISIYEVHLGSWKFNTEENRSLNYIELADELTRYLKDMGYTHVEFMPVMEHPYAPSWGYQVTGFFAPSSRFGTPQEFMYLVDSLHQNDIGVILDWVPAHFPADAHALANFDGSHVYEHPDRKKGFHPDWKSLIFNFERNEVRSFLISSALFWLDKYHIDGLRVDAVASVIYLDYSRNHGEWDPNEFGGNENLAAISFLKEFNEAVYEFFPDVQTIAEESTAFPNVSKPTYLGGLGFGMKWMMGWMHDTIKYFKVDPVHRKFNHNSITFSIVYAFTENFLLPLSHDEVVHGKGSMINKMAGDEWQKFANLRLLFSYMFTHPGVKMLFMGNDIAQKREWNFAASLDWHLLEEKSHTGMNNLVRDLNALYRNNPALYQFNFDYKGFEWVDLNDVENSVLVYLRKSENKKDTLLIICNFTPVPREGYEIGVPTEGTWKLIFNSDDDKYWGSNFSVKKTAKSKKHKKHNRENSILLSLAPLSALVYKGTTPREKKTLSKKK